MMARGRPPKPEGGARSGTLSFRIRPQYRAYLVAQAVLNGRSLSEEAEYRLMRMIDNEKEKSDG